MLWFHQFNKLATDDIFHQIDCVHVGILNLSENEHLEVNEYLVNITIDVAGRTIWDISWEYLNSRAGPPSPATLLTAAIG